MQPLLSVSKPPASRGSTNVTRVPQEVKQPRTTAPQHGLHRLLPQGFLAPWTLDLPHMPGVPPGLASGRAVRNRDMRQHPETA